MSVLHEVEANYTVWLFLKHPGSRHGVTESQLVNAFLNEKYNGKFSSANEYESTKSASKKLRKLEALDGFCAFFGKAAQSLEYSI